MRTSTAYRAAIVNTTATSLIAPSAPSDFSSLSWPINSSKSARPRPTWALVQNTQSANDRCTSVIRSVTYTPSITFISSRDVRKPNLGSVLKTRTEPKPKGQTQNFGFLWFSQNRICLIQTVNIWAILTKTVEMAWLASYRQIQYV